MRAKLTVLALIALMVPLAACGSGSPTVTGMLVDSFITDKPSCNGNGTQEVDLTNAAGTVIARDNASYIWQNRRCVVPFSFTNVPKLATYGIRLPDGSGSIDWLTPAQVAKPIIRQLMPLT